jgi:hypothetical protein
MHVITARQIAIGSKTGIAPESRIDGCGTDKAGDAHVLRLVDAAQLPPFGRRGSARSWLPGTFGDPF